MLAFFSTVFFLLITPGPGVLSLAGVGAAFGANSAKRYFLGLFLGTNLVALAVVAGITAFIAQYPLVKYTLLYASLCYLLYLAARIALAGSQIGFIKSISPPGVINGIALQLINPKAYVVNTALFAGFPLTHLDTTQQILYKFVAINTVWIAIHTLWLILGVSIQNLQLSDQWQRRINYLMAASLGAVVLLTFTFS